MLTKFSPHYPALYSKHSSIQQICVCSISQALIRFIDLYINKWVQKSFYSPTKTSSLVVFFIHSHTCSQKIKCSYSVVPSNHIENILSKYAHMCIWKHAIYPTCLCAFSVPLLCVSLPKTQICNRTSIHKSVVLQNIFETLTKMPTIHKKGIDVRLQICICKFAMAETCRKGETLNSRLTFALPKAHTTLSHRVKMHPLHRSRNQS